MKNKITKIILLIGVAFFSSCNDLDLNPLSMGSSENWYSNESEMRMALNDLYKSVFWPKDDYDYYYEKFTDDYTNREVSPLGPANISGQFSPVVNGWANSYKCIARANIILANLDRVEGQLPQVSIDKFAGEARFVRASKYAWLISHYGDVVYFTDALDLEESFTLSRTNKNTILQAIYEDYDFAASKLPVSYSSSQSMYATKGAALAYKARIALCMGDYAMAKDAAKACIDLGVYELFPDYGTLFLSKTKNPKELIFGIPRSTSLNATAESRDITPRNAGGWAAANPSWELFCSYLCTDGLPIDESPLFNPREPFKNRDPRCTATIVEFQTPFLGYMYQPHPDSIYIMNFKTGKLQKNQDTRSVSMYASFNGLLWKKGIDEEWLDDKRRENDIMLMRYADVLLMYAEAKIELNEIDQSVLDAINQVRARAYKTKLGNTAAYPAVITMNQAELRKIVRIERRMEFALEGLRYMDIIRWRLAEKVMNIPIYGLLNVNELRSRVIQPGLWFFPQTPEIDEDGVANFTPMANAGLIRQLAIREFHPRQYLWPIPTKEILINPNLVQNPGW